jgi:hypothetical protein
MHNIMAPDRVRVDTGTGRGGREQVAEAPGVGNGELLPEVSSWRTPWRTGTTCAFGPSARVGIEWALAMK